MAQIVLEAPVGVPSTVAQQVFSVGSGIAGAMAGFVLAKELVDVKEVPSSALALGTLVSAIFSFGAALLIVRAVKRRQLVAGRAH